MRFFFDWTARLTFLAAIYLAFTGNLQVRLPDTVMGYEVPSQARQWVGGSSSDLSSKAQSGFKQLSDNFR